MKKLLTILILLMAVMMPGYADVVENTLWEDTYTSSIELNSTTVSGFRSGDVLRVYLTVPDVGANFGIEYKSEANGWQGTSIPSVNNKWPWVNGGNSYYDITFTDTDISTLKGQNIYISKGENSTISKVVHIKYFTLSKSATNGSIIVKNGDDVTEETSFQEGTVLSLTPNPDNGYIFEKWTKGETEPKNNPLSVTMSEDKIIVAVFKDAKILDWDHEYSTGNTGLTDIRVNDRIKIVFTDESTLSSTSDIQIYQKDAGWNSTLISSGTLTNKVYEFAVADEAMCTNIKERGLYLKGQNAIFKEIQVVKYYVVTITSPTNGTITVKNGNTDITTGDYVPENTSLTLTAAGTTGYVFDKWTSPTSLSSESASANLSVTEDVTIAADFKASKTLQTLSTGSKWIVENGGVTIGSGLLANITVGDVLTVNISNVAGGAKYQLKYAGGGWNSFQAATDLANEATSFTYTIETEEVLNNIKTNGIFITGNGYTCGNIQIETAATISSDATTHSDPTLTITSPEHGTISVKNGNDEVASGTKIGEKTSLTLKAEPDTGYEFVSWTSPESLVSADAETTVEMTSGDMTIAASFMAVNEGVAEPEGSAVTATDIYTTEKALENWDVNDVQMETNKFTNAIIGDYIKVTISPSSVESTISFQTTSDGWPNLTGFTNVTTGKTATKYVYQITETSLTELQTTGLVIKGKDCTVNKVELLQQKHTLTVENTEGGNVTVSKGGATTDVRSFEKGASLTFTATPVTGAQFIKWQKDGTDLEETSTTLVTEMTGANMTIKAFFKGVKTLKQASQPMLGENLDTHVTVAKTAFANATASDILIINMSDAQEGATITLKENGEGTEASYNQITANYSEALTEGQTAYQVTLTSEILAKLKEQGLYITGEKFTCGNIALVTNGEVTADTEHVTQYLLTITQPSEGGSIKIGENIADASKVYAAGTEITLTAVASDGYIFSKWQKDASDITETTNSLTVTMNADMTITASFIQGYIVTITSPDASKGSIAVSDGTNNLESGAGIAANTQLTLTATAQSGYKFINWTIGENKPSNNPYTFTPTSAVTIASEFEPIGILGLSTMDYGWASYDTSTHIIDFTGTWGARGWYINSDAYNNKDKIVLNFQGTEGSSTLHLYMDYIDTSNTIKTEQTDNTTATCSVSAGNDGEISLAIPSDVKEIKYIYLKMVGAAKIKLVSVSVTDKKTAQSLSTGSKRIVTGGVTISKTYFANVAAGDILKVAISDVADGVTYTLKSASEGEETTNWSTLGNVTTGDNVFTYAFTADDITKIQASGLFITGNGYTCGNIQIETAATINSEATHSDPTLTITPSDNGSITVKKDENAVSSGDKIGEGITLTLKAEPAEGYQFSKWTSPASLESATAETSIEMTSNDMTITAEFEAIPETVTALTAGEARTLFEDANGVAMSWNEICEKGAAWGAILEEREMFRITISSKTDAEWPKVTVRDASSTDKMDKLVNDITEFPYVAELTLSAENVSALANGFRISGDGVTITKVELYKPNKYTLTLSEPENGTVVIKKGETEVKAGQFEEGTELTLTATAAEGYNFTKWTIGEEEATENPHTLTMTADKNVSATFTANTPEKTGVDISLAELNEGWNSSYNATTKTITTTGDWGARGWYIGDDRYNEKGSITVKFNAVEHGVTLKMEYTNTDNKTKDVSAGVAAGETEVTLDIPTNVKTIDKVYITYEPIGTLTLTEVTVNDKVVDNRTEKILIEESVAISEGDIKINRGLFANAIAGDIIRIYGTPESGAKIALEPSDYSGALDGANWAEFTTSPFELVLTDALLNTIKAKDLLIRGEKYTFTKAVLYSASAIGSTVYALKVTQPTAGGTIKIGETDASASQDIAAGESVTLTASPAEGYHLDYWTKDDTNAGSENTQTFTMESDVTVTASFSNKSERVLKEESVAISEGDIKINHGLFANAVAGDIIRIYGTPESGAKIALEPSDYSGALDGANWTEFSTSPFELVLTDALLTTVKTKDLLIRGEKYTFTKAVLYTEKELGKEIIDVQKYTLTLSTPENGTVVIKKGNEEVKAGEFDENTELTLTATAAEGYEFTKWQKNGEDAGTEATLTVKMTADMTIAAVFSKKPEPIIDEETGETDLTEMTPQDPSTTSVEYNDEDQSITITTTEPYKAAQIWFNEPEKLAKGNVLIVYIAESGVNVTVTVKYTDGTESSMTSTAHAASSRHAAAAGTKISVPLETGKDVQNIEVKNAEAGTITIQKMVVTTKNIFTDGVADLSMAKPQSNAIYDTSTYSLAVTKGWTGITITPLATEQVSGVELMLQFTSAAKVKVAVTYNEGEGPSVIMDEAAKYLQMTLDKAKTVKEIQIQPTAAGVVQFKSLAVNQTVSPAPDYVAPLEEGERRTLFESMEGTQLSWNDICQMAANYGAILEEREQIEVYISARTEDCEWPKVFIKDANGEECGTIAELSAVDLFPYMAKFKLTNEMVEQLRDGFSICGDGIIVTQVCLYKPAALKVGDIDVADLNGGYQSSYDATSKTITTTSRWAARGWDIGDNRYNNYDVVVVQFEAVEFPVTLRMEYVDMNGETKTLSQGASAGNTQVEIEIPDDIQQINYVYLMYENPGTLILTNAEALRSTYRTKTLNLADFEAISDGTTYDNKTFTMTSTADNGTIQLWLNSPIEGGEDLTLTLVNDAAKVSMLVGYTDGSQVSVESEGTTALLPLNHSKNIQKIMISIQTAGTVQFESIQMTQRILTFIPSVKTDIHYQQNDDSWYRLDGKRVSQPGRGIYIHNGKKIVIK